MTDEYVAGAALAYAMSDRRLSFADYLAARGETVEVPLVRVDCAKRAREAAAQLGERPVVKVEPKKPPTVLVAPIERPLSFWQRLSLSVGHVFPTRG